MKKYKVRCHKCRKIVHKFDFRTWHYVYIDDMECPWLTLKWELDDIVSRFKESKVEFKKHHLSHQL